MDFHINTDQLLTKDEEAMIQVNELLEIMTRVQTYQQKKDEVKLTPNQDGIFSLKICYEKLREKEAENDKNMEDKHTIKNKSVWSEGNTKYTTY